jgi:Fur family transcriptional regulator, ferric uptake regulator
MARSIIRTLDTSGRRLTGPRRAVAELIDARQGAFTAAELVQQARAERPGLGRATVFRTLDLFLELGAVERIELPDSRHAYVVSGPDHHHHVVCSRCGRITEIDDRGIKALTKKIAKRTGYAIDTHRLALSGLCPTCQAEIAKAK